MAFKIGHIPGSRSYLEEKADFWELEAIQNPGRFISQLHIGKVLSQELDEIEHEGIISEDDRLDDKLDDVFKELQRRVLSTDSKYPFEFSKYSVKLTESSSIHRDVYLFLLLCTRFNMKDNRTHNEIDGTLLFEELCAYVAAEYFGKNSSSYVFGTANSGDFESKVKEVINLIGEGDSFRNRNNNPPTKNDDALDVVVWKHFADKRVGKLIGFGQCKTGTNWKDHMTKLKPKKFCDSWFVDRPVFQPIPLYFICDTLNWELNFPITQYDYLVFNRFRILELIEENIPQNIIDKIRAWLEEAVNELSIKK